MLCKKVIIYKSNDRGAKFTLQSIRTKKKKKPPIPAISQRPENSEPSLTTHIAKTP